MDNKSLERTYDKITESDLKEMKQCGLDELERFLILVGNGKYSIYKDRLIAICLCQGAALHFIDGKNGIKDIDIWMFFREDAEIKIPAIRNCMKSKYLNFQRIGEKKVDFLKKMIPSKHWDKSEIITIQHYLSNNNNSTPNFLKHKPVVVLYPDEYFGKTIWPKNIE